MTWWPRRICQGAEISHRHADSGSSNNPVLRFLLFVPSTAHTPLRLASSTSPAFLIPQYGGVVIQNLQGEPAALDLTLQTLDRPFSYFTAHLSALLGLPAAPHALDGSAEDLAQWQLDTLVRMRTRENYREAVETLGGIVRLVSKIREMKVGRDVQRNVEEAVDGLQKVCTRRLDKSGSADRLWRGRCCHARLPSASKTCSTSPGMPSSGPIEHSSTPTASACFTLWV